MDFRPTRMLSHGRVRVVEPIKRRQITQEPTNSAASQTPVSTGSTLAASKGEPQKAGGERSLSTHEVVPTLRRMFKIARRASADQARLRRADQYSILKRAYSAVRRWKQDGVSEDAERELRRETELAIAPRSSLPLVLIRSILPKVDDKAASKWAAALEMAEQDNIVPKRFIPFLRKIGGIEGAHRRRARLRSKYAPR
jgi:hypothetical protein